MPKIQLLRSLLIIILICCFFILLYCSFFSIKGKTDTILVLRYDDYRNTSSDTVVKEILSLIENYDATCSFGVIPFHGNITDSSTYKKFMLNSVKTNLILEYVSNGDIEICQHGFSHQSTIKSQFDSEFKGLGYYEQLEKIKLGKQNLDSIFQKEIITFIPPWNSYDEVTLKALYDLNFKNVSSDCYGGVNKDLKFNYIPFTADITGLNDILNTKRIPYNSKNNVIILMIHDYDFKELSMTEGITDIKTFRFLFSQVVANKWHIMSINQAVNLYNIFNENQYRFNTYKLSLLEHITLITNIIPGLQKINLLKYYYLSDFQVIKIIILVILYYLLLMFMVYFIVIWLTPKFLIYYLSRINIKIFFSIGLFFALILMWFNDKEIGKNEAILMVIMTGIAVGLIKRIPKAKYHE